MIRILRVTGSLGFVIFQVCDIASDFISGCLERGSGILIAEPAVSCETECEPEQTTYILGSKVPNLTDNYELELPLRRLNVQVSGDCEYHGRQFFNGG